MAQPYRHVDASDGVATPRSPITDGTVFVVAICSSRYKRHNMSLDGRIEQLVENGLVIQVSVEVKQLSEGPGIAQETLITPSAL